MKGIYGPKISKNLKEKKEEFLKRFQEDGFYLLDVVKHPINNLSECEKKKRIKERRPNLIEELHKIVSKDTRIILIKKGTVCKVCADKLKSEGFNIIAELPFPNYGHQEKYRNKLREKSDK